jgi:PAS domain S-box-containing protein
MTKQVKEKKYSENVSLFKLILENAGDVLWFYDFKKNRYTYASPSVFRLRGFTPDEVEQQSLYDALTPDSAAKAHALVKQRIISIESGDLSARFGVNEFEQVKKDGSTVMTEVMTTFILDETGKVTGIVGIARNISKRTEEEYWQKDVEKKLYERQKTDSINRIIGGIAHELNNTLTPVSGYAKLLGELFQENDEQLEYCQQIHKSTKRASSLIDQLIDYTGSQYLQLKHVELNQAIVEFEQSLRSAIRDNIIINIQHDSSCPCVKIDIDKIKQIVFSLALNAQDAIPDEGCLTIDIKTVTLDKQEATRLNMLEGDYAQLIINDTGTGIDPLIIPHIFEPFFTTKDFKMAYGLGLSAIYGIVKQHYGNIEVSSTISKGTSASIILPLHKNNLITPLIADKGTIPAKNSHKTIMLVEDDKNVQMLIQKMLYLHGHTLLLASNTTQALELAKQHSGVVDLLITDLIMPVMSEKKFADELKIQYPDINIIFISGYCNEIMQFPPKYHFIQKPFSFKEFLHLVQQALDD